LADAGGGTGPRVTPAAPGPSSSPEDGIENVIHYLRFVFDGTNPGAAAEPQSLTALLLKDGRVFESEPRAPAEFDPLTRPPGSPGTGRWQRDGEAYALAFGDGTQGTAVAAAAKTAPAPAALSFSGTYAAIGGPARDVLPDRITFFDDGSLMLAGGEGGLRSARYRISERTIAIGDGDGPRHAFLFGYQGARDRPDLLIIADRVYERVEMPIPEVPAP